MIKLFLILTIILNPDTKIKALKLKVDQPAPAQGAFLKAGDFILLKNHIESGKCKRGLDTCVLACNEQIDLIMDQCKTLDPIPDNTLIKALEYELEEKDRQLKDSNLKADFYFYTSISLAIFSLGSAAWIYTTYK